MVIKEADIIRTIQNFANSSLNFCINGFPATSNEVLSLRESICKSCDQWDAAALNGTGRCRKCGCSTWAKLRMATERCPIGNWEAVPLPPAP
jgi:predicted Zn-ribbon and HTH transcriptional regulator